MGRGEKYGGRESRIVDLLRDIDGKVVLGNGQQRLSTTGKEVEFRKSIFGDPQQFKIAELGNTQKLAVNKQKMSRKSCLKMPTFEIPK